MNEYLVIADWWVDTLILAYLIRIRPVKGTPLITFNLIISADILSLPHKSNILAVHYGFWI